MNLKLEQWLTLALFGLTFLFVGAVSGGFYAQLRGAVLERTQNQLLSINILKKRLVEQYVSDHPGESTAFLNAFIETNPSDNTTDRLPDSLRAFLRGLETVTTQRTGMGATGESYLVNERGRMLTVSRFIPDARPGSIAVNTRGFRTGRAGQEGVAIYPDYRGVPIIGAYQPVRLGESSGVLLTEIDVAEAMQPVVGLRRRFLWFSLGLLGLSGIGSAVLARQLARPIRELEQSLATLARGALPAAPARASRVREIRRIAVALGAWVRAQRQTVTFAQRIGQGDFTATHRPLSEADALGHALLTMRDQLRHLNDQQERLARETKKLLVDTQEAERERLARDLHDGIGPLLTTAKLRLSSLPEGEAPAEIKHLLDEVIAETRRISGNLMPAVLRDFGPGEALRQLVNQMARSTDIHFHYVHDAFGETPIGKEVGIALYRMAQEAINNTLKHAAATEVAMSLTEFDDRVVFYYRDNGRGLSGASAAVGQGRGLKNIRERVRILGGHVRIYSEQGTIIEAEIPLV